MWAFDGGNGYFNRYDAGIQWRCSNTIFTAVLGGGEYEASVKVSVCRNRSVLVDNVYVGELYDYSFPDALVNGEDARIEAAKVKRRQEALRKIGVC